MGEAYIKIKDVHVYYPATLYNTKTIKESIFQALKIVAPKKVIEDVHSLKGISLDIKHGERVGIIGRNGAGKSTFLKTIAGIYPIRSGSIETQGKIRSLFDLSLGFEMEASGRENIKYRGLLLGESPTSIKERTEEIIEFAELGDFIDYPIKSYSAGMIVRLAFAISTMIEGDIILLDEVFSVGDANFVAKARNRIMNIIEKAKILVFVTHDLGSIEEICNRVLWVDDGNIVMDGEPSTVIKEYLKATI